MLLLDLLQHSTASPHTHSSIPLPPRITTSRPGEQPMPAASVTEHGYGAIVDDSDVLATRREGIPGRAGMVLLISCKTDRLGGWGACFAFPSFSFAKKQGFGVGFEFHPEENNFI